MHLAVKSVETLKSTRPVRALLIRGAPRNIKDERGRIPADLISDLSSVSMKQTLIEDLDNPRTIDCLMIKTPLKKVNKTFTTVFFMWFLMSAVYASLILFVFPCKKILFNFVFSDTKLSRCDLLLFGYVFFDLFDSFHLYV